jgi:alkanesulfonate monooxygenase SsuD/methylene tetrahydromethanopterin reductase-like flavin-dependent oxidoreductase (luciferase family)
VTGLDLGYSVTSAFSADRSPDAAATAVLDRAEVAAAAGYDLVEAGDHHVASGHQYLQNVPMAARLTETFDRVAVMFLLPLYHPVRVAEQVGTLDALVEQLDFWCAVGYNQAAFDAFGIPMAERGPRLEEALSLLETLWNEEDVSFDGTYYTADSTSVNPKADPRICIGGSAQPAVRRAAGRGDAWVVNADLPLDGIEERLPWVRDAADGDVELVVRRDAIVLKDGAAAEAAAGTLLADGYRGWDPAADWLLTGDAAAVAEDLAELRDAGVDEVVVRPMADDSAEETLRQTAVARDRL